MVNINIEVPDELHKRLKLLSTVNDKSLKRTVIEALEEEVERREKQKV